VAVAEPLLAERAPAPTRRAAVRDETAVHVHIGRIEVRANVPAAPAPPPRAREDEPAPALSLAAYLRGDREAR
jgi:hypothetical protein